MESINIIVVGAGVVGLAVAAKLSENHEGVYLFEKNEKFGQETSSHNSGVIHSGIHYPRGSLKAKLCVKGNRMLYEICEHNHIPYKKLGKLTVAIGEEEIGELDHLMKQGLENGVEGLEFLSGEQVRQLEPNVYVAKGLLTPTTGILEPDELMHHFYAQIQRNNAVFAAKTEVTRIKKTREAFEIEGISVGERFTAKAKAVINCAGLYSDKVAESAALDVDKLGCRIHLCKGDYFRMRGQPAVKMLVYPLPKGGGLGIHLTPDMSGSIRLGPNAYYVDKIDYEVISNEQEFREDVAKYLPMIREREIVPDSAGVRPKLQGPKDGFRDFTIRHEDENGLPGLVNLIGIESPGLTAAPAIAELVNEIYEKEIK